MSNKFSSRDNTCAEITYYSLRIRRFGIHFQTLYKGVRDIQNGSAQQVHLIVFIIYSPSFHIIMEWGNAQFE